MFPSTIGGQTTQQVGFFAANADRLAAWHQRSLGDRWQTRTINWRSAEDALAALAPKPVHSTDAWIPVGEWALLLNDTPLGTDLGLVPSRAAQALGCRAIRACADDEGKFPARILEVYGPSGAEPFWLERSIAAANDGGRWVFETAGKPFPFENLDAYNRRTKASRFTTEMVYDYLRELGVPIDEDPDWASAVLVERTT